MTDLCPACERDILPGSASQCPGCTELYCSEWCLEDRADFHVRRCTNPRRPLTTADTLTTAVYDDMFPDDPQTNEDYFFTRARAPQDKTQLLGLYIGILKYHEVKPSTLHQWRLSGTMVENIKGLYEALPAHTRGGYYAWFLKHLDIFEPRPDALKVWYCSKKCQQDEWNGHLVDCDLGRPINSADHPRAAVHRCKVPEDAATLSNYGLARVDEAGSKMLLDVYRILFEEGVRSRDIHKWQVTGNLLQEVEKHLSRLETWKTDNIVRWVGAHRYVFDSTMAVPKDDDEQTRRFSAAVVKLWSDVGDFPSQNADEIYSAIRMWSQERTDFFTFRSALKLAHPGPEVDSWLRFGFCACGDESEESFLNNTYQILSERCSYDEFLAAYENSKFIELLDAHELRPPLRHTTGGVPRDLRAVPSLMPSGDQQHLLALALPLRLALLAPAPAAGGSQITSPNPSIGAGASTGCKSSALADLEPVRMRESECKPNCDRNAVCGGPEDEPPAQSEAQRAAALACPELSGSSAGRCLQVWASSASMRPLTVKTGGKGLTI
ncbi:hypothetical protein DFH07DRAFT_1057156 [Mycena maculata]|uniref:MYND-type domain-containing protein n=1 Tax=Mycena maculata TaxID=230809 RepID=A0AAD7JZ93_9AGAR|nr:hypothetical protein DFH07DRAFT_1057156 [Mycena maculata]